MKASDLRIGNHALRKGFMYDDEKFYEVVISHNDITACVVASHKFKPIPITEEWLLKFGFENKETCFNLDNSKTLGHNFGDFAISKYDETQIKVWKGNRYLGVIKCQYIHQLQNIYFALTGEELKLKDHE